MNPAEPTLVDSHAHLDFAQFEGRLDLVLKRAAEVGVAHVLTVGISLETARKALEIAKRYPNVSAAAGIHPHDAAVQFKDFGLLAKLFETEPLVAVGETGLDFYRNLSPADQQEACFRAHLDLALARDLPLILHVRDAHRETLEILDSLPRMPRGVFHCFSGTAEFAREALDRGFFISVAGQVTYKNADALRAVVSGLPVGRLLVETDCPYLTPMPHRGRKDNEPAFVRFTAEKVAELIGIPYADLARATTANVWRLFGIGENADRGSIAYRIGDSLYLNITNRCPNACPWCVRYRSPYLKGYKLALEREPDYEEIIAAIGDVRPYTEVVFCGYGEPTERLDVVKKVAVWLTSQGARVRLDTNGLGSLIAGRDILPELAGLVDAVSVSLNTADAAQYVEICRPSLGPSAHAAVVDFVKRAKETLGDVTATAVNLPQVDVRAVRGLADTLGVKFRLRQFAEHG